MAEISFRKVRKTFPNGKEAIKDLDLEISHGEFLVLTGPSGSGKVTVLRMIAGMEPLSSGELRINGELVENGNPKKRNMGMIFQHYTLYPGMTVYDNIGFALKLHGAPEEEIRRAVEETAKLYKVDQLLSCYPRELNPLQKQYVAMARASVHKPEAFLLLDPLGSLDTASRKMARERLKSLHKETGTTLLYVTESAEEAVKLGARTVVMRRGRIEQQGPVEELLKKPKNRFVAQYMNGDRFMVSEVEIHQGKTAVEAIGEEFSVDVPPEWIERLEQAGTIGSRVFMGYMAEEPEDGEELKHIPAPDSRFYFFDRETGNSIG
ncbi:MAG: ABC transporter ATP-binding protein [Lachnospiraceae bacterium]